MDRTVDQIMLSPAVAATLDRLFRLHNDFVVSLAAYQLRAAGHPTDLAEDIAQMAWLALAPQLAKGTPIHNVRSYLRSCVRHQVSDYYRLRRHQVESPADWSDPLTARGLPTVPPADVDAVCLTSLTERQEQALRLAAQGATQSAIAARTGRSQQSVHRLIHRGARALRAEMAA
jgi:RNA polymerase sigma factor (sigma-70 family)